MTSLRLTGIKVTTAEWIAIVDALGKNDSIHTTARKPKRCWGTRWLRKRATCCGYKRWHPFELFYGVFLALMVTIVIMECTMATRARTFETMATEPRAPEFGALLRENGRPYYVGMMRDGRPHGIGTLTLIDGPIRHDYSGEFEFGRAHGHGQQLYSGPDSIWNEHFVGNFDRGERSGHGTCYWNDGAVYTGEWRFSEMHGHGTMTFASGLSWTGTWLFGARHGEGTTADAEGHTLMHTAYEYGILLWEEGYTAEGAEVFPWPESAMVHVGHMTLATRLNTSLYASERMQLFRAMGTTALRGLAEFAM